MVRSKLNSVGNTISKALTHAEISHEEFVLIRDESKKCCKQKESIRMMENQRSDIERHKLIEDGKKMEVDKMVERNEKMIINNLIIDICYGYVNI